MALADDYGYDDVPETMTRNLVLRALREHSASLVDFDREHPLSDVYPEDAVLAWLGY